MVQSSKMLHPAFLPVPIHRVYELCEAFRVYGSAERFVRENRVLFLLKVEWNNGHCLKLRIKFHLSCLNNFHSVTPPKEFISASKSVCCRFSLVHQRKM